MKKRVTQCNYILQPSGQQWNKGKTGKTPWILHNLKLSRNIKVSNAAGSDNDIIFCQPYIIYSFLGVAMFSIYVFYILLNVISLRLRLLVGQGKTQKNMSSWDVGNSKV